MKNCIELLNQNCEELLEGNETAKSTTSSSTPSFVFFATFHVPSLPFNTTSSPTSRSFTFTFSMLFLSEVDCFTSSPFLAPCSASPLAAASSFLVGTPSPTPDASSCTPLSPLVGLPLSVVLSFWFVFCSPFSLWLTLLPEVAFPFWVWLSEVTFVSALGVSLRDCSVGNWSLISNPLYKVHFLLLASVLPKGFRIYFSPSFTTTPLLLISTIVFLFYRSFSHRLW